MNNKLRIVIWILIGSCALNLVFAINAGQKRKVAVSKSDTLDARLSEIELRYKNAVQSYDAVEKQLKEAKKDLEEQQIYSETIKEALKNEQKKSLALRQEIDKLTVKPAPKVAEKPKQKDKNTAKSNLSW